MIILGTNSIKDTGFDVANSLRFNDGSSDYLNKTHSSGGGTTKATYSGWIKKCTLSNQKILFMEYESSGNYMMITFETANTIRIYGENGGAELFYLKTNALYRDPSAWMHIVVAFDSTQGTSTNRIKLYINGVQETSLSSTTYPSQDANLKFNQSGEIQYIGAYTGSSSFFDGYMSEIVWIDNLALDPTSFGEFDSDSGIWKPIDVSGLTFGNNGFYLDFENNQTAFIDSSSNARAITVSGNTNHSFTQAKFNESSIYFDGTNDSLDIADSSDFDFGTGNFTFEFWVYKTGSGKMAIFETRPNGGNDHGFNLEFSAADKFEWYDASISGTLPIDPSAITLNTWTHYACVRNGTTFTMYKNGTSVGTPLTGDSSSQASDGTPTIGESSAGANDFQGYLDEIRLSNTARYTGNFTAPTSPFTSDSDTVLLIQSKASNLIGADVSGQGNHFSSSGLTSTDQSTDTCTNNFCTFNPLYNFNVDPTYSEGNCLLTFGGTWGGGKGTMAVNKGKWYWEAKLSGTMTNHFHGIQEVNVSGNLTAANPMNLTGSVMFFNQDGGEMRKDDTDTTNDYGTFSDGDIIGIALNMDGGSYGQITIYKNDSAIVSNFDLSSTNDLVAPFTAGGGTMSYNFGGSPSFTISSGNADGNGYGNFEYAPPSGYYSLCTKNLAEFG